MDHEAWAQDMCKKPLACGSDHPGLAAALVANLLNLTQAQQGLDSLIALGKDMEILFRFCFHLHTPAANLSTLLAASIHDITCNLLLE